MICSVSQAKFCKNRFRRYTPFCLNLYQKLPISAIWGAVSPHFKSKNGKNWTLFQTFASTVGTVKEGANLGLPPQAKF